jgi:glycosyltransferase involved in cell wall biosynthesis
MPFFSVIIPLYNKAPYIRRSLNSVLVQSFKDFELIVVDDGSTDEGGSLVASYTDPRIRLIRQENAGVSAARNRGVVVAKAAWIAFLDADDEYFPNFLEKMHEAIVNHPEIGFVFCNPLYIGTSGISHKMINSKHSHFQVIDNYCDFLYEHSLGGATSSSIVINKFILEQVGCFPDAKWSNKGEDIDTWVRLGWVAKAGYEPSCLSVYHNEVIGSFWLLSETSSPKRRCPFGPAILISTYNDWKQRGIFPERMEKSWLRCLEGYTLSYVRELIQYGDKKAAWCIFLKELGWDDWWVESIKIAVMLILPGSLLDRLRKFKAKYWPALGRSSSHSQGPQN